MGKRENVTLEVGERMCYWEVEVKKSINCK